MNTLNWINGKLNKKKDGYYIDDEWILYDWEDGVLQKGVEWLCKKYEFESVLELGFGVGWTATEKGFRMEQKSQCRSSKCI